MGLFDKIGDVFEDVKDAVVDAAPVLLPFALNAIAPGMGMVAQGALGAGLGSLLQGKDIGDAFKAAALGGTAGAVMGGIGSLGRGETFMQGVGKSLGPMRDSLFGSAAKGGLQKPGFITSPFNTGPSTEEILKSSQLKDLVTPQLDNLGNAIPNSAMSVGDAVKYLKDEYTPSGLQRFGAPLGILALGASMSGGKEEEPEDYMMTGADLFYENPDDYKIQLYKEGGEVPSKYKGFSKLPEAVQKNIDPSLAAKYKAGGEAYPRRTGGIGPGIGSGTKDDVPALLMDGEFVMTRDAVKGAGNGSIKKGINRMYDVMRDLENKATA